MEAIGRKKFFLFGCVSFIVAAAYGSAFAQSKADGKARWDQVLAEAKKEGKVAVFGPPGDLVRKAMTDGFQKAFPGIVVEFSSGRSGEQATKLKAERDAGIFSVDLFLGGTTTANMQVKPIGAMDPIAPALMLPEVTDLKYWRDQKFEFSDDEQKYNLVYVNQLKTPLIYNLQQVKPEEVSQLHQLLDPKWKGKIVINDPLPSGAGNVTFRWIWQSLGPEKATDYYRKIRAHAGVVDRDQRRQIEWISQGKYALLLGPSDGVMAELLQRGLKLGIIGEFNDYGTAITASFGSAMLINKAPHPNAAKVFLNWTLTKDGQTAWSRALGHVSRRLDVPTDHLPAYQIPRAGGKYWLSHFEKDVRRSDEEDKILKELFGR